MHWRKVHRYRKKTQNTNGTEISKRINLSLTIGWLGAVPIAYYAGWYYSIAFISACSIYANFTGHLAAWRSDANPNQEQLDRIEKLLNELVSGDSGK